MKPDLFLPVAVSIALLGLSATPALAGDAPPLDGPTAVFADDLLDQLVGSWTSSGTVMGEPTTHTMQVDWLLEHQFLRIHERSNEPMSDAEPPYEAMIFIGYDHLSDRYVAHWIDVFGGRASETLGYGHREGDAIAFVFEYPDGPFHTTMSHDPASGGWTWDMRTRTSAGEWMTFGHQALSRAPAEVETGKKSGKKGK